MSALPACGPSEEIPDPRQMLPRNVLVCSTWARSQGGHASEPFRWPPIDILYGLLLVMMTVLSQAAKLP